MLWPGDTCFLVPYLDENLSYRDERSAELRREQAADKEIAEVSSEELQNRVRISRAKRTDRPCLQTGCTHQSDGHEHEEQHQVVEDQHPVLHEERLHSLQGMATV